MKKRKIRIWFVLIASFILMIVNISELNFNDLSKGPFAGLISSILLMIAMIIEIYNMKKNQENQL